MPYTPCMQEPTILEIAKSKGKKPSQVRTVISSDGIGIDKALWDIVVHSHNLKFLFFQSLAHFA